MQKTTIQLPEIKLVGIMARTNNTLEIDPLTSKILSMVQKYFGEELSEKIVDRQKPGTTYCVYTDYASDVTGDYTYFIGENVISFDDLPEGFTKLTIPAQNYVKFTNGPGSMPYVCKSVWQRIWKMTSEEFGGERAYLADFEIYDERARDRNNIILDVYVGIKI